MHEWWNSHSFDPGRKCETEVHLNFLDVDHELIDIGKCYRLTKVNGDFLIWFAMVSIWSDRWEILCVARNAEDASRPRRHESSSSSWGPTPQESESGDNQPEWRRPGGGRDNDNEEQFPEWRRPRPARDEEEQQQGSQPQWQRHRQEQGGHEQQSGGSWAQVSIFLWITSISWRWILLCHLSEDKLVDASEEMWSQ